MKPKILVVEDRPENIAVAKECYSARGEYHFDYARDYDEAMESLARVPYSGIITDCFMPKKTGSRDVSLGMSLANRLVPANPEIQAQREKFHKRLELYKKFIDINNPEVWRAFYVRGGKVYINTDDYDYNPCTPERRIEQTKSFLESYSVEPYKGESDRWGAAEDDHAWILEQMMRQTENSQPLGILVIDYARTNNIPHIMLTARHDEIGERVIAKWLDNNQIPYLNPRESEKSNPSSGYWIDSLCSIESGLKKGYQKWFEDHIAWLKKEGRI